MSDDERLERACKRHFGYWRKAASAHAEDDAQKKLALRLIEKLGGNTDVMVRGTPFRECGVDLITAVAIELAERAESKELVQ